ncbi:MAG TPA: hypothetical protein VI524_14045 [Anaerolineales bacterium]|nr:hypothetical protein [Anaerolineales bacterium]
MNTTKWIVAIALVLALSVPATPVSAQATAIRLTPPTPNPGLIGDDINFALVVDVTDINPGVAGVDIYLSYNPAFVAPSSSPLGVVEPLPDFFGPSNITWYEILLANCPGGANPCIHLVAAGPAQVTHSGAIARFHFQSTALTPPGPGACFAVLAPISMVDANGFPVVPAPALPGQQCVQIVSRNVAGTVLRQGTPAIPPGPGTLACSEVRLISGGVAFGPVFTTGAGAFALNNPPSGVQVLRAEYPGYLASQKSITISTGGPSSINVGATTLRGGDVNADNKINILDVGTIISKFGKTGVDVRSDLSVPPVLPADCSDPDEPADINDDANINVSDLAIAAANWGLTGPTPWPL